MNRPLTIIIVNYNSGKGLRKCLNSIFANRQGPAVEVIVIDNRSSDGSESIIKSYFRHVQLIKNPENLGFSKACNQGFKLSNGDYVLFLNPDTIIKNDALQQCLQFMNSNPTVGLLGPKLLNMDGTCQPSCADFPFLHKLFLDHLLRNKFLGDSIRNNFLLKYWAHDEIRDVDWVLGAFMLTRSVLIKHLGGFDECFFLYGEDLELCYRIKRAGWKVVFFPYAEVFHLGNPVWDSERLNRVHSATLTFYRKHLSFPKFTLLNLLMKMVFHLSCEKST